MPTAPTLTHPATTRDTATSRSAKNPAATTVATAVTSPTASEMATAVAGGVAAPGRPVELAAATAQASAVANGSTGDLSVAVPIVLPSRPVVAGSASSTGRAPIAGQAGRVGRVAHAAAAMAVVVVLSVTGLLGAAPRVAVAENPSHRITGDAAPVHRTSAWRSLEPSTGPRNAGGSVLAQGPAGGGADGNQLFTVLTNIIKWGQSLLVLLATAAFVAGGLRYLWAFGDPSEIDSAKRTVKAAVIGFGIAALASALASILSSIFGVG